MVYDNMTLQLLVSSFVLGKTQKEYLYLFKFSMKLGVVRVLFSERRFTRPYFICFSLGIVRDTIPPVIKKALEG